MPVRGRQAPGKQPEAYLSIRINSSFDISLDSNLRKNIIQSTLCNLIVQGYRKSMFAGDDVMHLSWA